MMLVMMKMIKHHHVVTATEKKKKTVSQLDKKFPIFYKTQKFIMMFTTAQHWPPVLSKVSHTPNLFLETTL